MSRLRQNQHQYRDLHTIPTRRSSDLQHSILVDALCPQGVLPYFEMMVVIQHTEQQMPPKPHLPKLLQALRSEEHTSELQSRGHHVCRFMLDIISRHKYITETAFLRH